ncbi:MAG TPA: hypothetical protein VJ998_02420, partial [Pseudomonadales bacterium]|nr:hypothetical protein [Pseudomonadales bacterium]
ITTTALETREIRPRAPTRLPNADRRAGSDGTSMAHAGPDRSHDTSIDRPLPTNLQPYDAAPCHRAPAASVIGCCVSATNMG